MGYPVISGCCLIAIAKGSIAGKNNKGDKGHPCWVPLSSVKKSELQPGNFILVLGRC